jgi:hypothetical protein
MENQSLKNTQNNEEETEIYKEKNYKAKSTQ